MFGFTSMHEALLISALLGVVIEWGRAGFTYLKTLMHFNPTNQTH